MAFIKCRKVMALAQSQKSSHLKPPKVLASAILPKPKVKSPKATKSHGIFQSHPKPPKAAFSVNVPYGQRFPNAKFNIGSVAPSCEKHVYFNSHLKDLANERQASFIPSDKV